MKKKALILVVSCALTAALAVGGTLAYLTAQTQAISNTFTVGNVDVILKETVDPDGNDLGNSEWSAKLIPGSKYEKDPAVSVPNTSEDCYLFVKFEEKNSADSYLNFVSNLTPENGWTQGNGAPIPNNVWYRVVNKTDGTRGWNLLEADGNKKTITVNASVGSTALPMPSDDGTPELAYSACAVQYANLTASQAYEQCPSPFRP